jgi:hypothetical protein
MLKRLITIDSKTGNLIWNMAAYRELILVTSWIWFHYIQEKPSASKTTSHPEHGVQDKEKKESQATASRKDREPKEGQVQTQS